MRQENYDYLKNQIKFSGFGETLSDELQKQMQKGEKEFDLVYESKIGNDPLKATLHFSRSDRAEDGGETNYRFRRYNVELKSGNNQDTSMRQTFYIDNSTNNRELKNANNFTLKEAYNLMQGRAVNKNFVDGNGTLYNAWARLNFSDLDKNGDCRIKKKSGFDLKSRLEHINLTLPIDAMKQENFKEELISSLEKGNRQSVNAEVNGERQKIYLEVNIGSRSLNFYDKDMKPVEFHSLIANGKELSEQKGIQQDKKKTQKQEGDDNTGKSKKQQPKRGVST